MNKVKNTRLIKNLIRDLSETPLPIEEKFSILNATNYDVEMYNPFTKTFMIIYPGTLATFERPKNFIYLNFDNRKIIRLYRSQIFKKTIRIVSDEEYNPQDRGKFFNRLSKKWVIKQGKNLDTIYFSNRGIFVEYF